MTADQNYQHNANRLALFTKGVLLVSLFLILLNTSKKVSIHCDEASSIGRGYFLELLVKGDFQNKLWRSYYSFDQPMITSYVYGALLYPAYLQSSSKNYLSFLISNGFTQGPGAPKISCYEIATRLNTFSNLSSAELGQIQDPLVKTLPFIGYIRFWNAFFLTISTYVVYKISKYFLSEVNAVISSFLWVLHPLIFLWGVRAARESLFLFSFLSTTLVLIGIVQQKKVSLIKTLAVGVLIGICTSVKIHGIVLIPISFFALFTNFNYNLRPIFFSRFGIILLFSFLSLFLLNPYLWNDTQKNTSHLWVHRINMFSIQQRENPDKQLDNPVSRGDYIFTALLDKNKNSINPITYGYFAITILLFATGAIQTALNFRNKLGIFFLLSNIFLLFLFLCVLPLKWERYLNILVAPTVIYFLVGVSYLFTYLPGKWREH